MFTGFQLTVSSLTVSCFYKEANAILRFAGWSDPRGFGVSPELCLYLCGPSAVVVEDPGFAKVMHLD